ncbi:MAG TPA: TonB-dependent receptor [Sphingobium sp.]|nr:TonB-dependent receptor [Sphingobium sp.]
MTAIIDTNEIGRRRRGKAVAPLSASVAMIALALAVPAHAQGGGQAGAEDGAIVVTGTRITSSGFNAPTPTQVVDMTAITENAQPNIFTTIAQLPSLQGSTGVTSGTNSTSSGTQGLSSFSLHGVGAIRTLTLLDGQRVVGANVNGVPDISLFPQILVKRVDVVTGGASASYGSDAVGGVVNFITDTRFEGFRANLQGGISTYGDNAQGTFQAAYGAALLDNRLHVVVSGEYSHEDGVGPGGFGEEAPGGRDWYRTSTLVNTGVRTAGGGPQYRYFDHAQAFQYTKYGLITSGPLQGTAFDAGGQPFAFNYGGDGLGQNGVPLKDAAGGIANCYIGFCVGGDLSGNVGIGTTMMSSVERWNGYGRVGFDLAPGHEIYGTVNIARVDTTTQPNPGASRNGLTIQCDNPFVPGLVQNACADNGITSFQYGVSNAILPNILVKPSREQYRFVGGAKGEFEIGGSPWSYDAYYQHGTSTTHIAVDNMLLIPRFNKAIQATVVDGQIVCADPVARANGCRPLNIFGGATPSDAVLSYLQPEVGPFQHTRQTQDAAGLSFSGEAFDLWAGPLSVAFGGEYRHEYYVTTGDPYGAGVTAQSPTTGDYPLDPLLATDGGNWYAGNYYNGTGGYDVYEGFLELNLPLFDSENVGKANLNGGVRVTDYSTSGTVWAWKVGGTWETPIDGLRVRAVTSRDIRAPNLSELFAAPRSINLPNFVDPFTNTSKSVLINLVGNPNLKPEIGRNTTVGLVLSRPQWAPGLSLSVDYFAIKIKDVISSLGSSQVVEYCKDGIMNTCDAFDLNREPAARNYINSQPFNFASIFINGLDIEASYQAAAPLGLPGRVMVRGLATHMMHNRSDPGLPGTIASEGAGVNLGSTPDWTVLASQSWTTDKVRLTVQERWISDGVYSNSYVVCQSSCPESTTNNPTIDRNRMRGAFYVDLSGSYNVTDQLQAYFKVDNLFNRDPEPAPRTDTGIDVNPALYDVVGRMYRVGVRYNF